MLWCHSQQSQHLFWVPQVLAAPLPLKKTVMKEWRAKGQAQLGRAWGAVLQHLSD